MFYRKDIRAEEKMYYICCAGMGYLLGSISPSYIISKIKKVDIRKSGTGNLGASNTFIHFGRVWGVLVMAFDILKAFFAVKLCSWLFAELRFAGLIAGGCAVVGHNHPFYLNFKGGKGLASYGGWVLAVDPLLFIILLTLCLALTFIFNYGFVLSMSAALLFPVLVGIKMQSVMAWLIAAVLSISLLIKHTENIKRAEAGEEMKFLSFVGKYVLKLTSKNK